MCKYNWDMCSIKFMLLRMGEKVESITFTTKDTQNGAPWNPLTHVKYRSDKNKSRDKIPNNNDQIENHSHLISRRLNDSTNRTQYAVHIRSRFIQLE
jgi:hypothetical protein